MKFVNGGIKPVLLSLLLALAAGAANAAVPSGLVEQLRHGGFVLLMRHASSPAAIPARTSADPENTGDERQLDDKGRATARAMGQALKSLRIPVGTVLSSPTYRAQETIRLAGLGPPKTYSQLGDGGQSMVASAVSDQAGWLREQISRRPAKGSNTVIVTQMPNIAVAFPDLAGGLTDGEALVFQPGRAPKLIAKVPIEDWPRLAAP